MSFPSLSQAEKDGAESHKTLLTNPTILALPRTTGQYKVEPDAYDSQLVNVLLQPEDGTAQSTGYWLSTQTGAEQRLAATCKDLLAELWALLLLQPYLGVRHIMISTDNEALRSLMTSASASRKLTKRRLRLLLLDFQVVYRAGIKHQAPNTLSRLEKEETDRTRIDKKLSALLINETEEHEDVYTKYFDQD